MVFNLRDLRTITDRYEAYQERNSILLPLQQIAARDKLAYNQLCLEAEIIPKNYVKMPTGTGKTVLYLHEILAINTRPNGDQMWDKPALIWVPRRSLVEQTAHELVEKFDVPENLIGAYLGGGKRCTDMLKRPILIMTYGAGMYLTDYAGLLHPEEKSLCVLDEVHANPRGPQTHAFLERHVLGKIPVWGYTASDLYKDGRTVGDHVFGGEIPAHETLYAEAIDAKAITGYRNIIVTNELSPGYTVTDEERDLSKYEQQRYARITACEEQAMLIVEHGSVRQTGKLFRDMRQYWYCADVDAGIERARRLNEVFGEGYARSVSGRLSYDEQRTILQDHKAGRFTALTNCQLVGLGWDDPGAGLCVMGDDTPNNVIQKGGRPLRLNRNDPRKIGIIISHRDERSRYPVFGELAAGLEAWPRSEFTNEPSLPSNESEGHPWPTIEGIRVDYTTRELERFRERRRQESELPDKKGDWRNLKEWSSILHVREDILYRRLFKPLQEVYDTREARQKFVVTDNAMIARSQRFSVYHIGHCRTKNGTEFCAREIASPVIRRALYGHVDKATPDLLSANALQSLIGATESQMKAVMPQLQEAFLDLDPYQKIVELDGVKIPVHSMGYFKKGETILFFFKPDALLPMYQLVHDKTEAEAKTWLEASSGIKKLKTREWLTRQNFVDMLDLEQDDPNVTKLMSGLGRTTKRNDKEQTATHTSGKSVRVAWRKNFNENDTQICIHRDEVEWVKYLLGFESRYQPPEKQSKPKRPRDPDSGNDRGGNTGRG